MYFTGQVQAQNLWATLKNLITSVDNSLATPKNYWDYIGSHDLDGVFQSTDGNGTLVRLTDAGIGLALALGVYESYAPSVTPGNRGVFGRGDYQLLYMYNGHAGASSYYPGPTKTTAGQVGPYWANNQSPEPVYMPTTSGTYAALPATTLVNYWLFVRKDWIGIAIQGDPANTSSILQFGMAGRMTPWSNEVGNAPSFIMVPHYKGYGSVTNFTSTLEVLKNKGGAFNQPYNWDYPTILNNPNVWDGNYYFSPLNIFVGSEGVRGQIDGFALISTANIANGDEVTVTNAGVTETWKHFVNQMCTNNNYYSSPMMPTTSIVVKE